MNKLLKTNALESEAIYIFREVISQFDKPVLLFSGGKDSITLVRLAQKAFFPSKIPFPLLHVDTGHNFPETIAFRDKLVAELGLELIVRNVQDAIDEGKVVEESGKYSSRNSLQTTTLLDAIEEFKFDCSMRAYEDWDFILNFHKEIFPVHIPIVCSNIFEVDDETTDRRGSSADALNFNAVIDYLYVYRRHQSPNEEIRSTRKALLDSVGLVLPIEMV